MEEKSRHDQYVEEALCNKSLLELAHCYADLKVEVRRHRFLGGNFGEPLPDKNGVVDIYRGPNGDEFHCIRGTEYHGAMGTFELPDGTLTCICWIPTNGLKSEMAGDRYRVWSQK